MYATVVAWYTVEEDREKRSWASVSQGGGVVHSERRWSVELSKCKVLLYGGTQWEI